MYNAAMDQQAGPSRNIYESSASDQSRYPTHFSVTNEENCFHRMCCFMCCSKTPSWVHQSGSSTLERPPGLSDRPPAPRMSEGTLHDVTSIGHDSSSVPIVIEHDRLPHLVTTPPPTSRDNPQSTSSSSGPLENVVQVMVDFWNRAMQLRRRGRRSQPRPNPTEESPPVSLNPEIPSDIPIPGDGESVKIIAGSSGLNRAVYKKDMQTADECASLLTVDEKTGEQVLDDPNSTPMKRFSSAGNLNTQITSESTKSSSTTQESTSAEEIKYESLLESADATLTEGFSSCDELNFTLKLPEQSTSVKSEEELNLITCTPDPINSEEIAGVGGYIPLAAESTGAQMLKIPMPTPTNSFSSGVYLDSTSKSAESLSTTQQSSGAKKTDDIGGHSEQSAESTGTQIPDIRMSTPSKSSSSGVYLDSSLKSAESLLTTQQSSGAEKADGGGGHLGLSAESTGALVPDIRISTPTKSVSSGAELDSSSKSTESLSATPPFNIDRTGGGGIIIPFMKANVSRNMSEFSRSTSIQSYSSGDELDFTSKSTDSLSNTQQVTGGENVAEQEPEQTEVPDQAEESADSERGDFSGKCSEDEGEN